MNRRIIIPALVAIIVVSTLVVSEVYLSVESEVHLSPLFSLKFKLTQEEPATVSGADVNLGTLQLGQSGNVSADATITVHKSGVYNFTLNPELNQVFSNYNITVAFTNSTASSSLRFVNGYPNYQAVYLNSGSYSVVIHMEFVVSNDPSIYNFSGGVICVYYV